MNLILLGNISLIVVSLIVGGFVIFKLLPLALHSLFEKVPPFNRVNQTAARFIADVSSIVVVVILLIFVLRSFPGQTTLVAVLITVVSGAFIFTSIGWSQDAFAGLNLQLSAPYQVNDWVTIAGQHGKVVNVSLFRTKLETLALDLISVKNSEVILHNIVNHSEIDLREVEVVVQTKGYGNYGSDIRRCKVELLSIANEVQDEICPPAKLVHKREPQVYVMQTGDPDKFHIVFYTFDRDDAYRVAVDAMNTALGYELRRHGVTLA